MIKKLLEGKLEIDMPFDTLDLKMAIIRVNCR
jgi:hypothetical protein